MTEERLEIEEARGLGRYLRYLGCPEDREGDLIQDARLALLEARSKDREVRDRRAFLRTCVRNGLIDLGRGARPESLPDAELIARRDRRFDEIAGDDMAAGFVGQVRDCLGLLDERERLLLRHRYWERVKEAQSAAELGVSVSAVKKILARARARMRACLERKTR